MNYRSMLCDGLWLHLAIGLQKSPAARFVLFVLVSVEVGKGGHINHPQITEEALPNIMASKYVQLVLILKAGVVASSLGNFGVQSHLVPVNV